MRRSVLRTYPSGVNVIEGYPVPAGGADDTPPEDTPSEDTPEDTTSEDEDVPLGEPGKKALDAERKARRDAEQARKQLEADIAELKKQNMSEQERAIEEARETTRNETLNSVNRRLFSAEAKASAAGRIADPDLLTDPAVALRLLGFDDVPLADDGDIDSAAISQAVDALLTAKPYLAASATRPAGTADGGPRSTPSGSERVDINQLIRRAAIGG